MRECPTCGNLSVIRVAANETTEFYACHNEECKEYAELLVDTGIKLENVNRLYETVSKIANEINKV